MYMYIYLYSDTAYKYLNGRQIYLLLAMDMAKVGGPLSVVKVCTSMFCVEMGIGTWVVRWSHLRCEDPNRNLNIASPLPTSWSSTNFVGYSH